MTETRRIKLHLAKCMEDLDKMYSVPEIKHKKAIMLCKTALKLFETAEQAKDKGDEEYSYVCYMKYLRLIAYIGKDQEYLREKKYYNDLLGVKNPNKALSAADMLRNSLIDRYANEQNTKRMNDLKDDYKHMSDDSRKKAKESAPDPPPLLGLPGQQEVTITSQHLYSLLKNTNLKIMILDARLMMDYVESHIEHPNCINVPEDAIKPGKSANALEQSLSPAAKLVWAERATMDLIVMLDWDSKTAIPGKSLFLLKTILLKWDIKVQYSRTPVALSGGYEDWLLLYPHHTTNAQVTRLLKSQSEDMLSEIDYPSWSDLSPPPMKMDMPGGPIIDRSSKAAALQMYLERSRNMQMILQKQEKIADTSLTLELQRIEAEQDWEKVHQESENEPQGDMRAQYQLREQEILSKLLQLENKQYDMEQENKSLRDQLEEYQRREKDDSSKLSDSIVTNQEAPPTNVESEKQRARELDAAREFDAARARIRAAEDQKADLHRKREVLEAERRRMLQEAREKKKPDYKEEDADTFMASGSMHRSQSSPDVAKLSSSEEETSAPIFDRSTKPMVRHEPMRIRDLQPVWGEVGPGLTGLKNLGNTCYMNSIIQCLNNTTALASYFSKGQYLEHVNRSNSTRGIIAEELAAVMHALWSGQYRFIAIDDLRREVGRHQRAFRGSEQQDSHEFLTILMDWLHDDLQFHVPSPHKDRLQAADKAWLDYTGSRESLILRLFHGQLSSSVACTRCAARSRTYDSFSNLSLSLPAARADLADCLKLYLNDETIPGWNCPTCKEKRTAIKKLDISRLPPVLVIHLKRFYLDPKEYMSNAYRKKQTYIDFPLDELNMSEFAPHIPDAVYKLYAVSNHYGSMESGHYTAYCKSGVNGRWYKYDDHLVSEISANEVKSSAAYILFYTACRQRRT